MTMIIFALVPVVVTVLVAPVTSAGVDFLRLPLVAHVSSVQILAVKHVVMLITPVAIATPDGSSLDLVAAFVAQIACNVVKLSNVLNVMQDIISIKMDGVLLVNLVAAIVLDLALGNVLSVLMDIS